MEIWKDIDWIKGFEDRYQVSNYGRVKSLERDVCYSNGVVRHLPEKIMANRIGTDGYINVQLSANNLHKTICVHILVATAFIQNPNNYKEVNHIDYNRKNNFVENLEWTTHFDNVQHSVTAGHYKHYGKDNPNYGSKTLKKKYSENPELAKRLSRPRGQNGKATKVRCFFKGTVSDFDCLIDCADWMIDNKITSAKPSSVASNIGLSLSNGKKYLGCSFCKI